VARVWPTLDKIAIDYTVAEPAAKKGGLAVIPGFFGWDDVGDFAAVSRVHEGVSNCDEGVSAIGSPERVIAYESSGLVISETDRVIAIAGLQDVVLIDTADALLVTTRKNAQQVKQVVSLIKESEHPEVL
jgi:mannose-1-phosphate guanylyltransferase